MSPDIARCPPGDTVTLVENPWAKVYEDINVWFFVVLLMGEVKWLSVCVFLQLEFNALI